MSERVGVVRGCRAPVDTVDQMIRSKIRLVQIRSGATRAGRRHYLREPNNPLTDALARYADFFGLFGDYAGYVDFFHLQDLVNEASSTVKFFTPFGDFGEWVLPTTLDAYLAYRRRAMEFIESRN